MKNQLYFAYGSNLNIHDLKNWCANKGVPYPITQAHCQAYLPDHQYIYNYYSNNRQGGALNLQQRIGHAVHGMLFEIDPEYLIYLDFKEGAPNRYERKNIQVITDDARILTAITYFVTPKHQQSQTVPPTKEYQNLVLAGMEDFGLIGQHQLTQAAQGQDIDELVRHVFVYGTLMREERNHHLIHSMGQCNNIQPGTTSGKLYHLGSYPGLVYSHKNQVIGELITHNSLAELLKVLDRLEAFQGYDKHSLYFRMIARVKCQDSSNKLAWTYHINLPAGFTKPAEISTGNWRSVP